MAVVEYTVGAELPDLAVTWRDYTGSLIDFSAGWTFTLKVACSPVFTKTTGITGAATDPNVTLAFTVGELAAVPVGDYGAELWARRVSDSKDRNPLRFSLRMVPAIA